MTRPNVTSGRLTAVCPGIWTYTVIEEIETTFRYVHHIQIEAEDGPAIMDGEILRQGGGYIPFIWYVDTETQTREPRGKWKTSGRMSYEIGRHLKDLISETAPYVWWEHIWGGGMDARRAIRHLHDRPRSNADRARILAEEAARRQQWEQRQAQKPPEVIQ